MGVRGFDKKVDFGDDLWFDKFEGGVSKFVF